MAKDINLFEQEIETTPRPTYYQASLPGISEKVEMPYEKPKAKQSYQHVKRIIEALLFTSSDPISFNKIREILDHIESIKPKVIRQLIQELREEYISQQRSFRLEEIAQGFVLRTCEEFSPYIELMYRNKRSEKLSQASAEVLAIIAYRQPITRPQIDAIRGVDSSGIIHNLLERQLIEAVGKLEAPGRPTLYGITKDFLKHFGLRDLKELPGVEKAQ
jgi:segregation and condensation protein B